MSYSEPFELRCTLLRHTAYFRYAPYCWAIRCCILLSYPTPYWASLHPFLSDAAPCELHCTLRVTLHPTVLRCILLNCAAFYWTTLHPTELYLTLLSYTAHFWATLHPAELRCTLLSYPPPHTATYRVMVQPSKICHKFWSMLHITEPHGTLLSNAAPTELRRILLIYCAPFWAARHPLWASSP